MLNDQQFSTLHDMGSPITDIAPGKGESWSDQTPTTSPVQRYTASIDQNKSSVTQECKTRLYKLYISSHITQARSGNPPALFTPNSTTLRLHPTL